MPLYFFRVPEGPYSGNCPHGSEYADQDRAWTEMAHVCGDLVGSVSRSLQQNTDWQMELLDEAEMPLFRIRLVAETLK